MFEKKVPLIMLTDPESLSDGITKSSQTQEKRLTIDLHAVRDEYATHEISNFGFVRGPNNSADGMTKLGHCSALDHLLREGKVDSTGGSMGHSEKM